MYTLLFLLTLHIVTAQLPGVWITGSTTANQYGVYGTLGNASASNYPGGRMSPSQLDQKGNLYVFGGYGFYDSGGASI